MKTKIFGMLAFVLVALAGTGIAYGHWTSLAYVNATVTSGTLDIQLSDEGITTNQVDKIVALVDHELDGNTLTITIDNAYPMLCVNGTFNLYNDGTIPAALNGVDWNIYDNDGNDEFFTSTGDNCGFISDDGVTPQMNISWSSSNDGSLGLNGQTATFNQIDPGQTLYVHWKICFQEGLEQSETWYIYSTWTFVNWNEQGSVA